MVGEILRKRREETGQNLRDISKILRIRYDYLKAIEDETFERLPEEVYVKGYIREYAELLHIEPETAVNSYVQQISPPQIEAKEIPGKETIPEKKKVKIGYMLITLFLVIAVTSVLLLRSGKKPEITQSYSEKRELTSPTAVETEKDTPPPAVETKKDLPLSQATGTKRGSPLTTGEVKKENILNTEDFRHTLQISASETTWLSVKTDGKREKELLMKPGETIKLQAKDSFSVKIGNAGGVKVIFDGKEIGALGERHQVIKLDLPKAST